MSTTNGVYSLSDLLQVKNASAAEFGIDHIAATVQNETSYTNTYVQEMLSDLAQPTTKQIEVWGGNNAALMTEVDEYGEALPKKQSVGINASVPLKRFTQKLGWTQKYFEIATPAEMATQYLAARKGYLLEIQRQIKKALFNNVSFTWTDKLYNGVSLTCLPLINADSSVLPDSPAGVTFDGATHDHYDGEASLTATFVDNMVSDVTEHGNTKGLKIFVSLTDAAAVTALTGYTALPDSETQTLLTQLVTGRTSDISDLENRMIGFWKGGIGIYVKPFMIASYLMCVATQMPEKTLLYRQRPQASLQGWRVAAPYAEYPLVSEFAEVECGFNVFNRTMAAILYTGNATYAVPTIA